jgi:hypothetical protein
MASNEEKIAMGQCVSERGADHCNYCVDCCKAFYWRIQLNKTLEESNIKPARSIDDSKQKRLTK